MRVRMAHQGQVITLAFPLRGVPSLLTKHWHHTSMDTRMAKCRLHGSTEEGVRSQQCTCHAVVCLREGSYSTCAFLASSLPIPLLQFLSLPPLPPSLPPCLRNFCTCRPVFLARLLPARSTKCSYEARQRRCFLPLPGHPSTPPCFQLVYGSYLWCLSPLPVHSLPGPPDAAWRQGSAAPGAGCGLWLHAPAAAV